MGEHFLKNRLLYFVATLALLLVVFFFTPSTRQYIQPLINHKIIPIVMVNDTTLSNVSTSTTQATSLRPSFKINPDGLSIESIRVDNMDALSNTAFNFKENSFTGIITLIPAFLMHPGVHYIDISFNEKDEKISVRYSFILNLLESFNTNIQDSEFLVIPDGTIKHHPINWFVKDDQLQIDHLNGGTLASLAFLYPFKDIDVTFNFTPLGKELDLVFYFLEHGRSIVIGNGNMSRITLLLGSKDYVNGEPFPMVAGETYHAHIIRNGNLYELYLAKSSDSWIKILSYSDTLETKNTEDSVGFSIWPGSDGIRIDNLSFFPKIP